MQTTVRSQLSNGIPPVHTAASVNDDANSEPFYRRPFNQKLLLARVCFWLWALLTKTIITTVYLAVISQGLRLVLPELGMKLYKIPGFSFMQHYKMTHRLDLAYVFALVPLVSAWVLWHFNLLAYLAPERFAAHATARGWSAERMKSVVMTMGAIIITADSALFYCSFVLVSWGGSKFSAGALLATVAYITILGFVTFVSMYLSENVTTLKKDE